MFKNLVQEMTKRNLKNKNVAELIFMSESSFSRRMKGAVEFTRNDMKRIKLIFDNEYSVDYLFEI